MSSDHYQSLAPMPLISHASALFSQHDVAWRESDKARRISTNLENCKLALQRSKNIVGRFQVCAQQLKLGLLVIGVQYNRGNVLL